MNPWYLMLPWWMLKGDTFEEFCEKFHQSWLRTGIGLFGVIGFEMTGSPGEPGRKYTVPECEHLTH